MTSRDESFFVLVNNGDAVLFMYNRAALTVARLDLIDISEPNMTMTILQEPRDVIDNILEYVHENEVHYWMDPLTVKDVVQRRMGECDDIKVPLSYYLPSSEHIGTGRDSLYSLYLVGIGLVLGRVTIDEASEPWGVQDVQDRMKSSGILEEMI